MLHTWVTSPPDAISLGASCAPRWSRAAEFSVHGPLRGQAGRVTHPSRPCPGLLLLPPGQEGQGSVNVTLLASFHATRLTTPPTLSVGLASPKHKHPAPFRRCDGRLGEQRRCTLHGRGLCVLETAELRAAQLCLLDSAGARPETIKCHCNCVPGEPLCTLQRCHCGSKDHTQQCLQL